MMIVMTMSKYKSYLYLLTLNKFQNDIKKNK